MSSNEAAKGKVVKVEDLEALIAEWQEIMSESVYGSVVDTLGDCAADIQKLINRANTQ
jgi:hypothetical protein